MSAITTFQMIYHQNSNLQCSQSCCLVTRLTSLIAVFVTSKHQIWTSTVALILRQSEANLINTSAARQTELALNKSSDIGNPLLGVIHGETKIKLGNK